VGSRPKVGNQIARRGKLPPPPYDGSGSALVMIVIITLIMIVSTGLRNSKTALLKRRTICSDGKSRASITISSVGFQINHISIALYTWALAHIFRNVKT